MVDKPPNKQTRYNKVSLNTLSDAAKKKKDIDISNQTTIKASNIIIIKRKGHEEPFQPKKLTKVVEWACENQYMQDELLKDTEIKLHKKIKIQDMYQQLILTAVNKISMLNPLWEKVAARLQLLEYYKEIHNISSNHNQYPNLLDVLNKGVEKKIYCKKSINEYTEEDINKLNKNIKQERDLIFNYKGLVIFVDKYCLNYTKRNKLELPQISYMRVAMALLIKEKENRIDKIIDLYDSLSLHLYTVATPIMLNALTPGQQLSSCILSGVSDDSHNIMDTAKNLGIYSKFKGGNSLDITLLRASGSYIEGTQGYSSGPVSFVKIFDATMNAFNQGGKRPGALIIYFAWWHLDVNNLLSLKSNGGLDENRARGLKYSLKVNQIFLDAVENDEDIYLFDPKDVPNLCNVSGEEFNIAYKEYSEKTSIRKKLINARELWEKAFKERSETGHIYLFHSENVNDASLLNRYIGSSNLCCLSGDTKVETPNEIKQIKDIEVGDKVKSYNTETKSNEFKEVTMSMLTKPKSKVIRITDEKTNKSIICTGDHRVWTNNRGYILADNLLVEDELRIH